MTNRIPTTLTKDNMRILTLNNTSYEMTEVPDEVEDLRFCVFDNSNPKEPDYFFIPLIFLESFNSPALVLRIGDDVIRMPVDWQILIGEPDLGDLEVVPLTSINDRGFNAFSFNPLSGYSPEFKPIEVIDIYHDVKWFFPKLKIGQMLAVPLKEKSEKPLCAYFVKDISRQSEVVDYSKAW
jgi:hypothetical protein